MARARAASARPSARRPVWSQYRHDPATKRRADSTSPLSMAWIVAARRLASSAASRSSHHGWVPLGRCPPPPRPDPRRHARAVRAHLRLAGRREPPERMPRIVSSQAKRTPPTWSSMRARRLRSARRTMPSRTSTPSSRSGRRPPRPARGRRTPRRPPVARRAAGAAVRAGRSSRRRSLERALAVRQVARPATPAAAGARAGGRGWRERQHAGAGRAELDGQRQAVDLRQMSATTSWSASASRRSGRTRRARSTKSARRPSVAAARLDAQRAHHVLLLGPQPERRPAGDDDARCAARRRAGRDDVGGVDDLLEVVEDEEQLACGHVGRQPLGRRPDRPVEEADARATSARTWPGSRTAWRSTNQAPSAKSPAGAGRARPPGWSCPCRPGRSA